MENASTRPEGEDTAERVTLPEKPLLVTVIIELAESPASILREAGFPERP
jgi:hypothetical protein